MKTKQQILGDQVGQYLVKELECCHVGNVLVKLKIVVNILTGNTQYTIDENERTTHSYGAMQLEHSVDRYLELCGIKQSVLTYVKVETAYPPVGKDIFVLLASKQMILTQFTALDALDPVSWKNEYDSTVTHWAIAVFPED